MTSVEYVTVLVPSTNVDVDIPEGDCDHGNQTPLGDVVRLRRISDGICDDVDDMSERMTSVEYVTDLALSTSVDVLISQRILRCNGNQRRSWRVWRRLCC